MLKSNDYKTKNKNILALLIALVLGSFVIGCGGGDSGDEAASTEPDPIENPSNRTVQAHVKLPQDSPLAGEDLMLEVFDKQFEVGTEKAGQISGITEKVTDAYLMLPQRESDSWPTTYLFSTILPGEEETTLSAEETALALIMQAIPQELLLQAGESTQVKQTIRENAQAFIERFQKMIEEDPYFLYLDNLSNVHDETYLAGVQDSFDALKVLVKDKTDQLRTPASFNRKAYNAAGYEVPEGMDLHVMPVQASIKAFYLKPVKEGAHVTGKISVINDTSLYGLATATDLVSGEELTSPLPSQLLDLAFSERLLPPQQSFWGAYASSESTLDVQHKDVIVDITTGALQGLSYEQFQQSTTRILMIRTIYSKMLIPSLDTVLGIGKVNYRAAFGIMYNAGLFDNALPALYRGDIVEAMGLVFNGLMEWPNPIVKELVSKKIIDDIGSAAAKVGLKAASLKVTVFIWAFDMTAVFNDAVLLPANVVSTVNFPVDLISMTPKAISRRGGDTIKPEEITLNGFGFKVLQHITGGKIPSVNVQSKDGKGETVKEFMLWPPLGFSDDGTEVKFSIPGEWLTASSKVETIAISLEHYYTERDSLGNNELRKVTLPLESNRANFTIQLGGMIISSLDKTKIQGNDELVLNVSGMSTDKDVYSVYFKTRSGGVVEATIKTLTQNELTLVVPHYDSMEVGPVSVYIENELGMQSNEPELTFIPEKVEFLSNEVNSYGELELGMTQPQGLPDIYYMLNGIPPEYNYSSPITIPDLTKITAYAEKKVDGVSYFSEEAEFTYQACEDGEELVNGQCESSCNRVCDNPIISDTVDISAHNGGHTLHMTLEENFKYCTEQIDHAKSPTGKVTMLYFYTWDSAHHNAELIYRSGATPSWDDSFDSNAVEQHFTEIKEWNGDAPPYSEPAINNYTRGVLSVTGSYTDAVVYSAKQAIFDGGGARYNRPESSFSMIVSNYGSPESYKGHISDNSDNQTGDFLHVKIESEADGQLNSYITVINPEFLTEGGCYRGDY